MGKGEDSNSLIFPNIAYLSFRQCTTIAGCAAVGGRYQLPSFYQSFLGLFRCLFLAPAAATISSHIVPRGDNGFVCLKKDKMMPTLHTQSPKNWQILEIQTREETLEEIYFSKKNNVKTQLSHKRFVRTIFPLPILRLECAMVPAAAFLRHR